MKSLKPLFANLKSAALVLVLAGLILVSGFIATKTLFLPGPSSESSAGRSVSASSGEPNAKVNSGNAGVSSANPSVTVWVNTKSGVYHCPNTRWYGNTKAGKYMTQREAQSLGYRPARGMLCG
jgi:hypothetical protein